MDITEQAEQCSHCISWMGKSLVELIDIADFILYSMLDIFKLLTLSNLYVAAIVGPFGTPQTLLVWGSCMATALLGDI